LTIPLLPAQILWINLLTHGIPGVALGAEPAEPGVMRRPPRPPQESVLGAGLARAVGWTGLALAVTTLVAGLAAAALGWPWQTMVFLVLGLGQLGVALAIRARRSPDSDRNRALPLAVLLSVGLLLAAVLVPVLRDLLGTAPLTVVQIVGCLVLAGAPASALLAARRLARLRSRHSGP
jgi:Ca2+-transporting ATPase